MNSDWNLCHKVIVVMCSASNVSYVICQWFISFLTGRERHAAPWKSPLAVSTYTPQDSVLCPVLLLLHIKGCTSIYILYIVLLSHKIWKLGLPQKLKKFNFVAHSVWWESSKHCCQPGSEQNKHHQRTHKAASNNCWRQVGNSKLWEIAEFFSCSST